MSFITPPNSIIIYEDMRSPHGYYDIEPGLTHIYPFEVNVNNPLTISIVLRNIDTQDESLSCWVSEQPLEYTLFPRVRYMSPLTVLRTVNQFTLYDTTMNEGLLRLEPNKTYFLNVHNRQNMYNQYGLMFDLLQLEKNDQPSPFF